MKKTILKTKCIFISIAILLQMIGNPLTTQAGWHSNAPQEKSSSTGWIILGVSATALITIAIIAISKKKREKKQQAYLQQGMFYSTLHNYTPFDCQLEVLKQHKAKQNDFVEHFLKSNSLASPISNTCLKTNFPGFSYAKKWDTNIFQAKPKHTLFTSNSKIPGYNF